MPHLTSIEEMALKEGRCQTICRQLERRCGKLLASLEESLRALNCEQLDMLAEALLDFQSPADLEAWLRNR